MPAHRLAYNKAAGADAKERTLRSYVEGHYKSERNESTGRSRANGLRENKRTYSVILGVFTNHGYDETVTLAQVFQQRESTGQPYRFFVTADKGTLDRDGLRRLRHRPARSAQAAAGGRGRDLRRVPQVRHLVAATARHPLRAGPGTVPSDRLDEIGRQPQRFRPRPHARTERLDRRVREIISHFDDLTKAHDAVKRAREQLEALEPIVARPRRNTTPPSPSATRGSSSAPPSGCSSPSFAPIAHR